MRVAGNVWMFSLEWYIFYIKESTLAEGVFGRMLVVKIKTF